MKSLKVIDKQEGAQTLAHNNTVFSQLLKLVPRHEFETLAQLSGRASLRDVASNLAKLYHLGSALASRSSLARVNEQQPYTLYEQLAGKLHLYLSAAGLPQVCQPYRSEHAADPAPTAAQSIRSPRSA